MLKKPDIPRTIIILIAGGFINSMGNSLMWPLNSLFMHNVLGRSMTEAGMIIASQSALSLLGQFLSGFLADRFGARRMMLIGLTGSSLTVFLIGLIPTWEVYAPGLILFGLMSGFVFVPLNALIQSTWPEGGRRGFNYLYVFNNAGVAVGTALGGIVAQISFRWVFLGNAATFLMYLLIVTLWVPKRSPRENITHHKTGKTTVIHDDPGFPALLALSGGILLVWTAYIQWVTIVPVVMGQRGFSLLSYSFLWTLNGIFIVILQPLIALTIRLWAHDFRRQFYLACLLIAGSYLTLQGHLPYVSYVVGMLILTLGEMLILPAVPAAAARLAPVGREGAYQGIVGGAASGGRMLGPFLGGIVFDLGGDSKVWLLALGFMAAALVSFLLYAPLESRFHRSQTKKESTQ
ncbi:MAG: MFS transporter [Desulfitobacteriaceae bacterium]